MRRIPANNPSLDDLARALRDIQRDLDRVQGGGLTIRGDLDMRNYRILNLGNAESIASTAETVATDTTATAGGTFDVAVPASSTVNAIATWGDSSGTTLLSGAALLTSAGALSGVTTATIDTLTLTNALTVANGGTGRATSTTAYALLAAGTTATGAHQTLAAGATTEILVGGGASALPVWTTATGSGAPVRATSPTLTTPNIGAATGTSLNLASGGGSLSLATGQRVWLGGSGSGASIRQDVSANMQFNVSSTDVWRITAAGHIIPQGAFTLGIVNNGIPSIFLDEAGAGTQTAQLIAPTLSADIVLTTPDATGTLCRTDGDAIGSTTPASGKFTTLQRRGGTGTGYAGGSGTLHVDTTAVGNVGAGTDTLMSYTLPANTLATNGDWVRVTATFTAAINANNKRFTLNVGGTAVWSSGNEAFSGAQIVVTTTILRTGSNAQLSMAHAASGSTLFTGDALAIHTPTTKTDTAAIVINFTGQSGAGTTDDCIQNSMLVEYGSLS